jgi:hypothetical protein
VTDQILLKACLRPVPALTFGPGFHSGRSFQHDLLARRRIRAERDMDMNVPIARDVTIY